MNFWGALAQIISAFLGVCVCVHFSGWAAGEWDHWFIELKPTRLLFFFSSPLLSVYYQVLCGSFALGSAYYLLGSYYQGRQAPRRELLFFCLHQVSPDSGTQARSCAWPDPSPKWKELTIAPGAICYAGSHPTFMPVSRLCSPSKLCAQMWQLVQRLGVIRMCNRVVGEWPHRYGGLGGGEGIRI